MLTFNYKSVTKEGETKTGTRVAKDTFALSRELKSLGETLITADEITPGKAGHRTWLEKIKNLGTIGEDEKIVFARSLGSMMEAGLPVARALTVLERQMRNPKFKKVISAVAQEISEGKALNVALASHPKVFTTLFISMVRAGEESGKLSESLKILATQMERSFTLKKKVKGAMLYPSVILVVMIAIAIGMFVFIVPTLIETFEDIEAELPLSTQFVIWVSNTLQEQTTTLLVVLGIAVVSAFLYFRTEKGKRTWHWILLHTPFVKTIVKETNAAYTGRTLSSLMASGVEIVQAITITKDVVQNVYFKEVLDQAENAIQKGTALSAIFIEHDKRYPPLVGEMMAVGEETGKVSEMLGNLAHFYEEEVDRRTKDMSTVIEPVLMVVIGVAVGFFALSMITPIYSLVSEF